MMFQIVTSWVCITVSDYLMNETISRHSLLTSSKYCVSLFTMSFFVTCVIFEKIFEYWNSIIHVLWLNEWKMFKILDELYRQTESNNTFVNTITIMSLNHFSSETVSFRITETWIVFSVCSINSSFTVRTQSTSWRNLLYSSLNKLLCCMSCHIHMWIELRMNIWVLMMMQNQRCALLNLDMLTKIMTWLMNTSKLSSLILLYISEICCELMIMYVFLSFRSIKKNSLMLRKYFLEESVICVQKRES